MCHVYKEFRAVDTALNNQRVSVFKDVYLSLLSNTHIGYAAKRNLEIISHLYSNYAFISTA